MHLIDSGMLARPLRTMRFLWVSEWEGTAAYIEENMDVSRKYTIGINLDMVGENPIIK
jgi:hypothetical protein